MTRELVDRIADAVLYEGYLLYPYRPSVKNRQRWTFGGLLPPVYCEAQEGTESSWAQTECLVAAGAGARLRVRVRFLQLQVRRRETFAGEPASGDPQHPPVWQEAVEREVVPDEFDLAELAARPVVLDFAFPPHAEREPWIGPGGEVVGRIVREQDALAGAVEVSAVPVGDDRFRVTVRIANRTPVDPVSGASSRDDALRQALVSTHTILNVRDGEFVSMIDPPEACREPAAACKNVGAWPVLIGEPGERHTMLSAPIILYDYPEIAPESPGDLFDATEIDEILTLRIMTLTDEEKRAMAAIDDRARALLERTESMAPEALMGLHGTLRNLRPL